MIRDLTLLTGITALAAVSIGALAASHSTADSVTTARLIRLDAKPIFIGTNLRQHVRCLPTPDVGKFGVLYASRQCRT